MKARIAGSNEPVLAFLHYDYPNRRIREDYYLLDGSGTKLFSSIKKYHEFRHYMVFYKSKMTPRSCAIVPVDGDLPPPDFIPNRFPSGPLQAFVVVGTSNVTCSKWTFEYGDDTLEYCETPDTKRPVYLEWFHGRAKKASSRYDVIAFQAFSPEPVLFDEQIVSEVPCTPLG
eukprot:GILK01012414.1.p1 GENE.GILK01012414.1~~GILK01012414.1.p1  ORF type:complete len:186 (-),score=26.92 GILK01012414.1:267-782(-)